MGFFLVGQSNQSWKIEGLVCSQAKLLVLLKLAANGMIHSRYTQVDV